MSAKFHVLDWSVGMRVSDIGLSFTGDSCEFRATICSDARRDPLVLWYRFPAELAPLISQGNGNSLAAALLLPAMRHGERIELPVPLSPRLVRSIKRIQTIYHAWQPTLSIVDVIAPLRESEPPVGKEVGLFFSSGVDSFYSLTKNTIDHPLNDDVITQLITVYGIDVGLEEEKEDKLQVFEAMMVNTNKIARQLGKGSIRIETNIKDFMMALDYPSGTLRHGAALASVGLFLEPILSKLYVAADEAYQDLHPAGNHPVLDPLWSTENLLFIHDGCEATRLQKIKFISQFEYAMDALRICWNTNSPDFNCGRCWKCLVTMLGLHLAGVLKRCPTLPDMIDVELLRHFPFLDFRDNEPWLAEILDNLDRSDADIDVAMRAAILEGIASSREYFDRLKKARRAIDRLISPENKFILVDQDKIRSKLGDGRKIFPFLERNGEFFGAPDNGETAVRELERLRGAGAKFIVLWYTEFWWLDYYEEFKKYLASNYRLLLEDDSLIVFELVQRPIQMIQSNGSDMP